MGTMLEELMALQELDVRRVAIRREISEIPRRKAMAEERRTEARRKLEEAEQARKKNAAAIRELEVEIESLRQQLDRLLRQQFEVKTNEQYRALQHEMATHRERIRQMEDREIELMEEGERLAAEVARVRAALQAVESEVERELAQLDGRVRALEAELAGLDRDRSALAGRIPAEWLGRYERILSHHRDRALVPLENQTCGGCHMVLPPQTVQDARRGENLVTCSYCGRLLYYNPS